MDKSNKIISLILGLFVVILFIAIITNRFNLRDNIQSFIRSEPTSNNIAQITGTPENENGEDSIISEEIALIPEPALTTQPNTQEATSAQQVERPNEIPATGLPSIFLPMMLSAFVGGAFLRNVKK